MQTKKQEKLYLQFEKMIHSKARFYSKKYSIDYTDCFSESCLVFVEACYTYNEKKATFSTYLYRLLDNKLNLYCKKIYIATKSTDIFTNNTIQYFDSTLDKIFVNESISTLSELSQKIIKWIFYNKKEKKITKEKIENAFSNKGVPYWKIRKSFKEIKEIL